MIEVKRIKKHGIELRNPTSGRTIRKSSINYVEVKNIAQEGYTITVRYACAGGSFETSFNLKSRGEAIELYETLQKEVF